MDIVAGRSSTDVLLDLAHDLRGPLGGIDSLSYYLEMIGDQDDPRVRGHYVQLRRFVQQACWLLDDATRFLDCSQQPREEICVNAVLSGLATKWAADEERLLDLSLEPHLPTAGLPLARTQFAFDHLFSFIYDIAGCEGLPVACTRLRDGSLDVQWSVVSPGWQPGELLRWLDPSHRGGGLRRFTEAVGGAFRADDSGGRLQVNFLLPALR